MNGSSLYCRAMALCGKLRTDSQINRDVMNELENIICEYENKISQPNGYPSSKTIVDGLMENLNQNMKRR